MKFDKSKVYTALNADELEIGSKVILADNLSNLKGYVSDERHIRKLTHVATEDNDYRFSDNNDSTYYALAYLVEPPPKEHRATCRELSCWLAHNNGQCWDTRTDIVYTSVSYQRSEENNTVPLKLQVRRWGDDEWHTVTKEYLGEVNE